MSISGKSLNEKRKKKVFLSLKLSKKPRVLFNLTSIVKLFVIRTKDLTQGNIILARKNVPKKKKKKKTKLI